MSILFLRNTTPQVQELTVRESSSRRLHPVFVQGHGQVDIDHFQITGDVRRKVLKGIFKAFDENGNKLDFIEDGAQEAPAVEPEVPVAEPEAPVEDSEVSVEEEVPVEKVEETEKPAEAEVFTCDDCGQPFESKRALSSHKRSHK